jgi:hypothetical protein
MRKVNVGGVLMSRLVCGSNPFNARSHFSGARDAEYATRFSDAAVVEFLEHALDLGLDTYENSASERAWEVVNRLRLRRSEPVHFIGSTRIDDSSPMRSHAQKLRFLIEHRAELCVIHAQHVERERSGGEIPGLERMLDEIHEAGLLAGLSLHRIETVERCEAKRYPVDAYLFPLNLTGFVYPGYPGCETPEERAALVRGVSRPFVLMKVLAAGRLPPQEALPFVFEHAKPNDLVSIGFGTREELEETVRLAEQWLA